MANLRTLFKSAGASTPDRPASPHRAWSSHHCLLPSALSTHKESDRRSTARARRTGIHSPPLVIVSDTARYCSARPCVSSALPQLRSDDKLTAGPYVLALSVPLFAIMHYGPAVNPLHVRYVPYKANIPSTGTRPQID